MNHSVLSNRQNKKERHRTKRNKAKQVTRKQRQYREATQKGQEIIYQITHTINHYFPDLWERVNTLVDPRKKSMNTH